MAMTLATMSPRAWSIVSMPRAEKWSSGGAGCRGDDPCADHGQLHGGTGNAAAGALHQYGSDPGRAPVAQYHAPCRQSGDAESGGDLHCHAVGQGDERAGGHGKEFGESAVAMFAGNAQRPAQ
jgi:hypothetical protein